MPVHVAVGNFRSPSLHTQLIPEMVWTSEAAALAELVGPDPACRNIMKDPVPAGKDWSHVNEH